MNVTEKAFHEFPPLGNKNPPTLDWYKALAKHIDRVKPSDPIMSVFRAKLEMAFHVDEITAVGRTDEASVLNVLHSYLIGNHEMLEDFGILSRGYWKSGVGARIIDRGFNEVTEWIDNCKGPVTVGATINNEIHYVEYRTLESERIKLVYAGDYKNVANVTYETANGFDLYVIMLIDDQKYAIRKNGMGPFVQPEHIQDRIKTIIRVINRCTRNMDTEDHYLLLKMLPAFFDEIPELN